MKKRLGRFYFRIIQRKPRKSPPTDVKKPEFGNIRDELFLISFVILCAGLVYTDAYYQRFGFRYNLLNITTVHIIYKGLAMILTSPFMLIPYMLTLSLIVFEIYAIRANLSVFLSLRTPIIYGFLIVMLVVVYYLAQNAGVKQAYRDMFRSTSGLPKIQSLKSSVLDIEPTTKNKYVLFLNDGDFVTIFVLLSDQEQGAFPILKRISTSEITYIETTL